MLQYTVVLTTLLNIREKYYRGSFLTLRVTFFCEKVVDWHYTDGLLQSKTDQVYVFIEWLSHGAHNIIKELVMVSGYWQLPSLPSFSPLFSLTYPKAVQLLIYFSITNHYLFLISNFFGHYNTADVIILHNPCY